MASRNSFLDSPSFRRITTPSQRSSVESRRRSSGFRGGSGGSSIRRETEQERVERTRQERLRSFQSELSDSGSRLTPEESRAILEGRPVSEVREQVVSRQRREGFASLQRDLSRSGDRLTSEEARLIAEGEASPNEVRARVTSRRGRTFASQRSESFVTVNNQQIPVSEGFARRTQEELDSGRLQTAQEEIKARRTTREDTFTRDYLNRVGREDRGFSERFLTGMSGDLSVRRAATTPFPGAGDFDSVEVLGLASNFVGGRLLGAGAKQAVNFVGRRSATAGLAFERGGTGLGLGFGGAAVVDTAIRNPERIPGLALTSVLQGAGFVRGYRGAGISVERVGTTRTTPSGRQTLDNNVLQASFTQETPVTFNVFGRTRTTNRLSNVNVIGTRNDPNADFRVRISSVTASEIPTGQTSSFTRFSDSSLTGFASGRTGAVLASNRGDLFASVPVLEQTVFRDSGLTGTQVVSETFRANRRFGITRFERGVSNEFVASQNVNVPRVNNFQSENFGVFRVFDRPRTSSTVSGTSRSARVRRSDAVSRNGVDFGSNFVSSRAFSDPTGGIATTLSQIQRPLRVNIPRPSTNVGGVRGLSGFTPRVRPVTSRGFLSGLGFGFSSGTRSRSRAATSPIADIGVVFGLSSQQSPISDIGLRRGARGITDTGTIIRSAQRTSVLPRVSTNQLIGGIGLPRPSPRSRTRPVPPRIPLPQLNFGISPRRTGRGRSGRREEFTPSLVANFLGIRGERPSVSTGIEVRPIIL